MSAKAHKKSMNSYENTDTPKPDEAETLHKKRNIRRIIYLVVTVLSAIAVWMYVKGYGNEYLFAFTIAYMIIASLFEFTAITPEKKTYSLISRIFKRQ